MSETKSASPQKRFFDFLSGFGLATFLLILLMVLTWLATLEQVRHGLHVTLNKYFYWKAWYILPDAAVFGDHLEGKYLPPLPGGYWVCVLLVINLTLGGVVRMRKGWKTAGVLVAHLGIILMIVAGGVAQLTEQRGVMMLGEDATVPYPKKADYSQGFTETAIELVEVQGGEAVGAVHEVLDRYYLDLQHLIPIKVSGEQEFTAGRKMSYEREEPKVRRVILANLPFDLRLTSFATNAAPVEAAVSPPMNGEAVVNGWYLRVLEPELEAERNAPGIVAQVLRKDGSPEGGAFLLAVNSLHPYTVNFEGKKYAVRMDKKVWPLPFAIELKDARSEFYPNTSRPKLFESDVVCHDPKAGPMEKFIEMNEPLRHRGYTLYQRTMMDASMGSMGLAKISGFEVVNNPSDKWPEWSIYLSGFGLVLHFGIKLWTSIRARLKH